MRSSVWAVMSNGSPNINLRSLSCIVNQRLFSELPIKYKHTIDFVVHELSVYNSGGQILFPMLQFIESTMFSTNAIVFCGEHLLYYKCV